MAGQSQVPPPDLDEKRIAPRGPDGQQMPDQPDRDARSTKLQAKTDRASKRAVQDRKGPWGTCEQDRLGQRAVDRDGEAGDGIRLFETGFHALNTAPPPKLKKLRKKELAAKAMEMPKTI